ncbi:uncharacterized protein LOC6549543 [Drosophila erecta]|uniref:Uncharacterized protein n=1 Tax=Drosophila erecta TaxID=7220 RepID=B3NRJ7_DROER|nr:uncharacterized protein LOC6549543 [Drosophila erecta]EDV56149.1 uncharacterized protein Dere_GG20390 [Drosophila erecta]
MSTDEDSLGSPLKPATPTPGEREREPARERHRGGRSGAADLLRHQQSFEARYSGIIQKQIWETSINKDVLERQLNAYFPFSRSASLTKDASGGFDQLLPPATGGSGLKTRSLATTPTRRPGVCLEKLETVDVASVEPQKQAK